MSTTVTVIGFEPSEMDCYYVAEVHFTHHPGLLRRYLLRDKETTTICYYVGDGVKWWHYPGFDSISSPEAGKLIHLLRAEFYNYQKEVSNA